MQLKKNYKGYTILEIILTLAIFSIILLMMGSFFSIPFKTHSIAKNEFELQSNMRIASEDLNNKIKFSPAVFTLKKEQFEGAKKPGWTYFGIEEVKGESGKLKHEIVEYRPIIESETVVDGVPEITYVSSGTTHQRNQIIQEPKEVEFKLTFKKDITASNSKLLEFVIEGVKDGNMQREMIVSTQLEALNAIVVEHIGDPAVAIAYKEDTPGKRVKENQDIYAAITLVLDFSGSMKGDRISSLKEQTQILVSKFAKIGENVYINIIPYSDTANSGANPQFLKAKDFNLSSVIKSWNASGSTNTGDALRISYERLNEKPGITTDKKINHYNIVLTDGKPEAYSYYVLEGDKTGPDNKYPLQRNENLIYSDDNYGWFFGWYYRDTDYYYFREQSNTIFSGVNYYNKFNSNEYSMNYVKHIGKNKIAKSPLEIKSYIIGFGSGDDNLSKTIASYCVGKDYNEGDIPLNIDGKKAYYNADNSSELNIVYSELVEIVKGDMWHVMGPY